MEKWKPTGYQTFWKLKQWPKSIWVSQHPFRVCDTDAFLFSFSFLDIFCFYVDQGLLPRHRPGKTQQKGVPSDLAEARRKELWALHFKDKYPLSVMPWARAGASQGSCEPELQAMHLHPPALWCLWKEVTLKLKVSNYEKNETMKMQKQNNRNEYIVINFKNKCIKKWKRPIRASPSPHPNPRSPPTSYPSTQPPPLYRWSGLGITERVWELWGQSPATKGAVSAHAKEMRDLYLPPRPSLHSQWSPHLGPGILITAQLASFSSANLQERLFPPPPLGTQVWRTLGLSEHCAGLIALHPSFLAKSLIDLLCVVKIRYQLSWSTWTQIVFLKHATSFHYAFPSSPFPLHPRPRVHISTDSHTLPRRLFSEYVHITISKAHLTYFLL